MRNEYSIINPNNYIYVMPKNACKIGMINKKLYVVCLYREEYTAEENMVVHDLRMQEGQLVERYEGKLAKDYFMKMLFY
mgnify:CR=1 FL=1